MQPHNYRELALNCRVNLEHRVNRVPVSNQTRHKKMDRRQEWHRNRGCFRELALSYRVIKKSSCKEVKGLARLDYW